MQPSKHLLRTLASSSSSHRVLATRSLRTTGHLRYFAESASAEAVSEGNEDATQVCRYEAESTSFLTRTGERRLAVGRLGLSGQDRQIGVSAATTELPTDAKPFLIIAYVHTSDTHGKRRYWSASGACFRLSRRMTSKLYRWSLTGKMAASSSSSSIKPRTRTMPSKLYCRRFGRMFTHMGVYRRGAAYPQERFGS